MRTQRFLRGRQGLGEVTAAELLARARATHAQMMAQPRVPSLSAPWNALGPGQVTTASFGPVTGRVTALALDLADTTGNTLYVGTTGGGVWKSTNAAGPIAAASFVPLTDTLPVFSANAGSSSTASLSIGALAAANGVLLAGTGDPNDATDSYYGSGLLRSADGGVTWTLIDGANDGTTGFHRFYGLSFAGIAFSTANPSLVVAAVSQAAEGTLVNAPDLNYSVQGLYYSTDAGVSWHEGSIYDGSHAVQVPEIGGSGNGNAATAVVWNPVRQRFYAAVQFHGYYESLDGQTWTRLAHQPGAGLTTAACPTDPSSVGNVNCPIFRGALAVQPVSGDLFALTVDASNRDQGLWRDVCGLVGSGCASSTVLFGSELGLVGASPLEVGNGSTIIAQGDYDLTLAASASGADTVVYAGTVDLFRCSLAAGCVLRNTTNAENGCTHPAGVAGAQHAIATLATAGGPLVFLGNDGGLYRSTDGVDETGAVCSASDAGHFQNLNPAIGSLSEVVSFAQHPTDPATVLAGMGALGTAGSGTVIAGSPGAWLQLAAGEGGRVAIDPANPLNWYVSTGSGVSIGRCGKGAACTAADFAGTTAIGAAQVANDGALVDAPWMLDPAQASNMMVGTCRMWRGLATGGAAWPGVNELSAPFGAPKATGCSDTFPVVRSVGAGGAVSATGAVPNQGSEVLYAGLAGVLDGGGEEFGGHVFRTATANTASATTAWTDIALSPVSNDFASNGVFNASGFDVSSVVADPHDGTGNTVYVTVMGFAGNGYDAEHLLHSSDGGAHWTNFSSNLPNAPANSVVVDPNDANTVYVALDTGVYVTSAITTCPMANCWNVYGAGLPNAPVIQLSAAAGMAAGDGRTGELRAATFGRGIWEIPLLTAVNPLAPGLTVNPTMLSFPSEAVGTLSAAMGVTVTNSGNAALTVSSVTATGDFTQTNGCTMAAIAPGATCTVMVSFLPSATGSRTGVLTVYGNAPGGQAIVSLIGTGTAAAAVVLTPTALTFPTTAVGLKSAVQNVTVSNAGTGTASLTSEGVSGDFAITQNTCGSSLAAKTGCTISIVFGPTVKGAGTGALTVVDSAGTQTATLGGTGVSPATDTISPTSLSFAAQVLNTASAAQQVTMTNSGGVVLSLISAQIVSGDFTVVNGCGNSLTGPASCAFSVAFVPKKLGAQTGVLQISDEFQTQVVMLNGTGVAPAGVSLTPVGGVSFGATAVGSTSASQAVTLTNNGGVALSLSGVTVMGEFGVATNGCGGMVAVGASCSVGVVFSPTGGGTRTGMVSVASSAMGSPQTLGLTGAGVDFTLVGAGPLSEMVTSGGTANYLVTLGSVAGVPGTATLGCSGAPANTRCTVNPGSVALGGNTVLTVTVVTGTAVSAVKQPDGFGVLWVGLLGLVGVGSRRRLRGILCGVLLGICLVGLSSCGAAREIPLTAGGGGSGSTAPTPGGRYALTVTGTSAGLTRTLGLSLTVQ